MGESTRIELPVVIGNALGIHARPASLFVQLATQYESEIKVISGDDEVDGKSLMGLLMLAAGKDTELLLVIEGPDALMAKEAFYDLVVKRKFDEE